MNAAVWRFGNTSIFRISQLNLIVQVTRMESERKVSQVFNSNPEASRLN